MIADRIKSLVESIPDFPKQGITFRDITPILLDSRLSYDIADAFVQRMNEDVDAVCAIESRGFFFGMLIANRLGKPFIPIRKEGKLPGMTHSHTYDLEYGSSTVEMHANVLNPGDKVLVHDDLLATGGTAAAAGEIVEKQNASVSAFAFLVELTDLNGRGKLTPYQGDLVTLAEY